MALFSGTIVDKKTIIALPVPFFHYFFYLSPAFEAVSPVGKVNLATFRANGVSIPYFAGVKLLFRLICCVRIDIHFLSALETCVSIGKVMLVAVAAIPVAFFEGFVVFLGVLVVMFHTFARKTFISLGEVQSATLLTVPISFFLYNPFLLRDFSSSRLFVGFYALQGLFTLVTLLTGSEVLGFTVWTYFVSFFEIHFRRFYYFKIVNYQNSDENRVLANRFIIKIRFLTKIIKFQTQCSSKPSSSRTLFL